MKNIKDYEDLFAITRDGQVWSHRSKRFLAQHKNNSGYLMVWFKIKGKNYAKTVHRLVANAYISNIENHPQVNHVDGNKENNHQSNLNWCTIGDNHRHAWDTGLRTSSDAHKKSSAENGKKCRKLSKEDVLSIRKMRIETDLSLAKIGDKFNIGPQSVHKIVNKITYKDIDV